VYCESNCHVTKNFHLFFEIRIKRKKESMMESLNIVILITYYSNELAPRHRKVSNVAMFVKAEKQPNRASHTKKTHFFCQCAVKWAVKTKTKNIDLGQDMQHEVDYDSFKAKVNGTSISFFHSNLYFP
jgi:hypothetical protein